MPAWLWCCAITLAVVLLQRFEGTGVFLMMLAAPFWSVLLVNLGFVLLLVDVVRGRTPLVMASLPLVWFGGYAAATIVSHRQAADFAAAIDEADRGRVLPWSPAAQDLVIALGPEDGEDLISARMPVTHRGLTRAFTRCERANGEVSTEAMSLCAARCPDRTDPGPENAPRTSDSSISWVEVGSDGRADRYHHTDDLCLSRGPGSPGPDPVVVSFGPATRSRSTLVRSSERTIDIRGPGGSVALRSGTAALLSRMPRPIIGCALDSANPSWDRFASFERDAGFGRSTFAVVTAALDLPRTTLNQRFPAARWR